MNPESSTDTLSEPADYTPITPLFSIDVQNISGVIPFTSLPIGPSAYHLAAGDDPRLTRAVSSVACIADLHNLPIPVVGLNPVEVITHAYYADAPGGGNHFRWDAANSDLDNGGTVIRPYLLDVNQSGRWLAANYNTGEANAAQFGANPARNTGSTNRNAIQAAHDSLPVVGGYPDTMTGRRPRTGHLFIPPGLYCLDGNLNFYTAVRVEGGGWRNTTLLLNSGVYTGSTPETYFVNFEHSGLVDPNDPNSDTDGNNHFGAELFGLTINCNFNERASGVYLAGAQGVRMGECMIGAFGVNGVYFIGEEITTLWISGGTATGSGLILGGGQNNTVVHNASVEHMNSVRQVDANGDAIPYVLIEAAAGVVIEQLTGETAMGQTTDGAELFLKIKDSHSILVRSIAVNKFNNNDALGLQAVIAYITGDSGNIQLDSIATINGPGENRTSGLLVKDDSRTGGGPQMNYQVDGAVGYTTYKQGGFISALGAESITYQGHDVLHEVFNQALIPGRLRLVFDVTWHVGNILATPQYLIRIATGNGEDIAALFSINKPYQGNAVVSVVPLSGSGLIVTSTGTGTLPDNTLPMPIQVKFVLVKPTPFFGDFTQITVANLGTTSTSVVPLVGTWSTEVVTVTSDSSVFSASTDGTLGALVADASGKLPVRAVALKNLFTAAITKTANYTLSATDPDIEADPDSGTFTLTLHSASGNAGLTRTISNVGTVNSVTVATPMGSTFNSGSTSKTVRPGTSLRLKVNTAENQFITV